MHNVINSYLRNAATLLETIAREELTHIVSAAGLIANAYAANKRIYVFGCTHSAILAQDVFYRAGAPCFWQPLWGPGMSIDNTPGVLTSAVERNEQLGNDMINCSRIDKDDVLVVISTSGKNACPVAVASSALKKKAKLIIISSSAYANESGNHTTIPSLWKLSKHALLIDNHISKGDVSIDVSGVPMGPLSTIAGSFIMHALSAEAVRFLIAKGITPPVFMSSNTANGAEFNAKLMQETENISKFMLP